MAQVIGSLPLDDRNVLCLNLLVSLDELGDRPSISKTIRYLDLLSQFGRLAFERRTARNVVSRKLSPQAVSKQGLALM